MIKKKYKLVYIEWADAISTVNWETHKSAIKWANNNDWIVRHVGWILEENNRYILIAGSWTPQEGNAVDQFGSLQKIPKTWIRKRKILKI